MADRTTKEAKREAFERAYEAYCMPAEADWFRREDDDPDDYYHATTHDAWWAWQAALQWQAEQQKGEEEVIGTYGRGDGHRDWVSAGAWLREGDRIVVMRAPVSSLPQAPQPTPFLPGEYERMTENGRKAWAGVDPKDLRAGGDGQAPLGEQWRPIESAPKDGTRVILAWGGRVINGFYLDNSKTDRPWAGWRTESTVLAPAGKPVAWQPFPTYPKEVR